jgi:hypothetical protein
MMEWFTVNTLTPSFTSFSMFYHLPHYGPHLFVGQSRLLAFYRLQ